jgi:hypothetical protein
MCEADISWVFDWIDVDGQHVDTLVLHACRGRHLPPYLFRRAAPSLSNITWLEVSQRHSLVHLAPVLGQLPQLKHLGASVDLGWSQADAGVFMDETRKVWEEVPDMQQLCPQLVEIDLSLRAGRGHSSISPRLALLLPARLQQLSLTSDW